jgi:hypothetical protein
MFHFSLQFLFEPFPFHKYLSSHRDDAEVEVGLHVKHQYNGQGISKCPYFVQRTQCFCNWICFHPRMSGRDAPTVLGSSEWANLYHWEIEAVEVSSF